MRGKRRVLDIGCGFGLFGCYFSAVYPEISYHGYDLNPARIDMARLAAQRLGLANDETLQRFFVRTDTFPISDWLPYPHIVYLAEKA